MRKKNLLSKEIWIAVVSMCAVLLTTLGGSTLWGEKEGQSISKLMNQESSLLAGINSMIIDLNTNTYTNILPGVSFIIPPGGGKTVLKINTSNSETVCFDVQYDNVPTGWTVNIGDSITNDGWNGDAGTQANDAELQINGSQFDLYGNDYSPSPGARWLKSVPYLAQKGETIRFIVRNGYAEWDDKNGAKGQISSPYLYALNGQPDSEGPVNYDIFAAFNRVIANSSRAGTGVAKVTITLYRSMVIDLVNNTYSKIVPGVSFVARPYLGATVLRINMSIYGAACFDVEYGNTPKDWTVDIGDSISNNGWGGDAGNQSYDAELQIIGDALGLYGNDFTAQNPILQYIYGFAQKGRTPRFIIKNEYAEWNNDADSVGKLNSPYLYGLAGQWDYEGPVNYDIFAAFNRVVSTGRTGTGVTKVTVTLSSSNNVY